MKIAVMGAGGRMGRMLVREISESPKAELSGAVERDGSPLLGHDAMVAAGLEPGGIAITDDATGVIKAADAIIDFTAPGATRAHTAIAAASGTALIIGTTGLSADDEGILAGAGGVVPVVYAPNMSLGVNLLMVLVEQVSARLNEAYDIEIFEMHHRHKVDAPSGTALGLGRSAAAGRGVALDDVACYAREGHTGARPAGQIGFATQRGGDVVGDHVVSFAGEGERIELAHRASDRRIYARGAVHAALWTSGQSPGLYGMRDVLGF